MIPIWTAARSGKAVVYPSAPVLVRHDEENCVRLGLKDVPVTKAMPLTEFKKLLKRAGIKRKATPTSAFATGCSESIGLIQDLWHDLRSELYPLDP